MLCPMFAWQGYLLHVLLRDFRWLATPDNFVNHLLFRKLSYKIALSCSRQREKLGSPVFQLTTSFLIYSLNSHPFDSG